MRKKYFFFIPLLHFQYRVQTITQPSRQAQGRVEKPIQQQIKRDRQQLKIIWGFLGDLNCSLAVYCELLFG